MIVQKLKKLCRSRLVKNIAGGVLVFLLMTLIGNDTVIYKTSPERGEQEFEPILSPDVHDHDDILSRDSREESQVVTADIPANQSTQTDIPANQSTQTEPYDLPNCLVIHIAVQCTGADQVRQVVFLLRTLLFHCSDRIILHVMTDEKGHLTLQTLLETWKLYNLEITFYPTATKKLSGSEVLVTRRRFHIHKILPNDVTKTWPEFQTAINEKRSKMYFLPCHWLVRIEQHFNFTACIHGAAGKAIWMKEEVFTRNSHIEMLKEHVFSILSLPVETLHDINIECSYLEHKASPSVLIHVNMTDPCAEFRFPAQLPITTHLYYIDNEVSPDAVKKNDVTLVTQLTLDRFSNLECMVSNWDGRMVVVVHASDEEALSLLHRVSSSEIIKKKKNIVFHVVYKRQIFNPINYLRNVGISHVKTPYTVMIDVDLVPSPNLYPRLLDLLSTTNNSKVAWVVPAFNALESISAFPKSKTELLQLIRKKKAIGYGYEIRIYIKIHLMQAHFIAGFEPYVVLPTDNIPRYDERLLERMRDKMSYGCRIHSLGYKFMVLPDVFILHLPHPLSRTTVMYTIYPGMSRCGVKLFREFREELEYNMTNPLT